MFIARMFFLPGLVPFFTKCLWKMYFEVHPSFMRIIRSIPCTAVHRVKTGSFYQVFGDGYNLSVCVGVFKGHGFLSVLDFLHEGFELFFSADWALHSLVYFMNFLACESPIFAMEVSNQSKTCYSWICRVFFSWLCNSTLPELDLGVFACRPCQCRCIFSRHGDFLCVLAWGLLWWRMAGRAWELEPWTQDLWA